MPEPRGDVAERTRHSTLTMSVRQILAARRDAVLERLEDVARNRSERDEAVHQLRVSSRRADAALEFLLPWLPKKKTLRLRRKLAKLRRVTGRVRDCDVLQKLIRQMPRDHRPLMKARMKRRRRTAERRLAKLVRHMRSKGRHCRRWDQVIDAALQPSSSPILLEPAFQPWAVEQFCLWLAEFASEMTAAIESFGHLHAFRLSGKRLRYALELVPEEHQREAAQELMCFLKELQEELGTICDQEALRQTLKTWADKSKKKAAARLAADENATAQREDALLTHLHQEWPTLEARLTDLAQRLNG